MTGFGHLAAGGGTAGYIVAAGREPRGSANLAELGLSHEAEPRARSIRRLLYFPAVRIAALSRGAA